MTVLVRGENSYFMGAQAFLLDDERETASDWASQYIQPNPAIKWVLGKYVEADNPNNNKQAWAFEDLRMSQPTIDHAPMNMVHAPRHIVGAFVGTEMLYPTDESADDGMGNPYIEALGAFWKYYFPEELALVQRAHDEGSLFFSMECVAKTITFEDPSNGDKQEFAYKGPRDASYGEKWNTNREATRWLNQPHFLAGALIIPPARPGWSGAEIKSLAQYVEKHQEISEAVYASVENQAPHLSPDQLERVTLDLIKGQMGSETAELIGANSISPVTLTNTVSDESSDHNDDSLEGGDNVSDKTFTEDDIQAAVAEAVAPIMTELTALKAEKEAEGVEATITQLKAEFEGEVATVRADLDNAVLEATAAKEELAAVVSYLESVVAEEAAAAEIAARKEERLSAVKEAANFPDEYVEANTDRWASMDEESFASLVDGFKAAVEAASKGEKKVVEDTTLNTSTAMTAEQTGTGTKDKMSGVREIMRASVMGADPRTI